MQGIDKSLHERNAGAFQKEQCHHQQAAEDAEQIFHANKADCRTTEAARQECPQRDRPEICPINRGCSLSDSKCTACGQGYQDHRRAGIGLKQGGCRNADDEGLKRR